MEFMVHPGNELREVSASTKRYREYLESIRNQLPANIYQFAVADWKLDFRDHRCLHDSWIESVTVREVPSVEEENDRQTEVALRLQGAFHDGDTTLVYRGVCNYEMRLRGRVDGRRNAGLRRHENHGDWLIDEIRLGSATTVVHEILFSSGASWVIEFRSLEYSTTIPAVSR